MLLIILTLVRNYRIFPNINILDSLIIEKYYDNKKKNHNAVLINKPASRIAPWKPDPKKTAEETRSSMPP